MYRPRDTTLSTELDCRPFPLKRSLLLLNKTAQQIQLKISVMWLRTLPSKQKELKGIDRLKALQRSFLFYHLTQNTVLQSHIQTAEA